jgi:hypothetical protein
MKPRQKVVTAEDITSSLYFLHVEQPEDMDLVTPPAFQEPDYRGPHQQTSNIPPLPVVQRKAVPGPPAGTPSRKPLSGPLGPVNDFENRQNVRAGNYGQQPSMLAPDYNARRSLDPTQHQRENQGLLPSPRRSPERPRAAGTSLTLIRRDPASGAQWNVARIEDPTNLEVSSSTLNDSSIRKSTGAPMYINVTNPGYSKFLHSEDTGRPDLHNQLSELSVRSSRPGTALPAAMPTSQSGDLADTAFQNTFRRRLWMEGSQYSNGGFGHRKNSSYDMNSGRPGSRGSYDARVGGHPTGTNQAPAFLSRDDQAYSTIQVSDRPTSFRGYVFNSPWNGRCEFITGAGGGSLKV